MSNPQPTWEKLIPPVLTVVFIGGSLLIGAANDETFGPPLRDHLARWWWLYLAAIVTAVAVVFFVWRYIQVSDTVRALLITCVVVPVLIVVLNAIVLVTAEWQAAIVRTLFVLVAATLPAVMYYLFIATKRPSLFDEFLTNLRRLRLIPQEPPPEASVTSLTRNELDAYLQKFEATYGQIPEVRRLQAIEEILGLERTPERAAGHHGTGTGDGSIGRRLMSFEATNLLSPRILLPLALSTLLIGLGWLLVLPPWEGNQGNPVLRLMPGSVLDPIPMPVSFAFLGAYFFSLQMLFRRYVLRDLRPAAYLAICQRIVLTVVATWVVLVVLEKMDPSLLSGAQAPLEAEAALARPQAAGEAPATAEAPKPDSMAPERRQDVAGTGPAQPLPGVSGYVLVTAFLVGMFPRILWDLLALGAAKLTFAHKWLRRMQSSLPLSELDGLSIWHEARLEEEDIENMPNLATADIVELMLNTRFAPSRIIDWVDQAILYTALGPAGKKAPDGKSPRERLREQGIRTASALLAAHGKARSKGATDGGLEAFLKILPAPNRSPIRTLVDTLKTNPNLLLVLAWQDSARRVSDCAD